MKPSGVVRQRALRLALRICAALIAAAMLSVGTVNLFPAVYPALGSAGRAALLVGLALACFALVFLLGLMTWQRFRGLTLPAQRVWGGISVLMGIAWLLTPFDTLFPGRSALLIPGGSSLLVSLLCKLDMALLFFAGGVWLVVLLEAALRGGSSHSVRAWHVALLLAGYLAFSLMVTGPGLFHPEMYVRLPAHISGKPLLTIIFDAQTMNLGGWEARQLSFLFDIVDGNFVAWSIRLGMPNFRSITTYVFALLAAVYLWVTFTREMKLPRLFSLGLVALLLVTPSLVYNNYYRTSKIGVTLMLVILLCELYRALKGDHPRKPWTLLLIFFFATLAMTLFDILGVLVAGALAGYCFVLFVFKPNRHKGAMLGGLAAGLAAWAVYFLWLGPALTLLYSGHPIDSTYLTQAPFSQLLPFLKWEMPAFFGDMLRTLFGFVPALAAWLGLLVLAAVTLWPGMSKGEQVSGDGKESSFLHSARRAEPFFTLLALVLGVMLVYDFLVTRHPPILWPEVRYVYYIMPAQAALLFGIASFLARPFLREQLFAPGVYPVMLAALLVALVGNAAGTVLIKGTLESGTLAEAYRFTPLLLDGLRHLHSTGYAPSPAVLADPVYQLFAKMPLLLGKP